MTRTAIAPAARSFRAHRRARVRWGIALSAGLAIAVVVIFVLSMSVGSVTVPPLDVVLATIGSPTEKWHTFIIYELRLPRAITAVVVGLALGASGAIFQRLLRNPLASPDFLGVSSGANVAVVAGFVLWNLTGYQLSTAAIIGGFATAILIYVLAWRGTVSGYRFILVGIGISSLMASATSYLLTRATISDAKAAMSWLIGSVGMAKTSDIIALAVALVLLLPASAFLGKRLRVLELGDGTATALGARVTLDRLLLMLAAVILVALATAAAGPIAFVALMAGPIASRISPRADESIFRAACVGALIVQLSDMTAQHLLATPISTGIVTGFVGAPYIAWIIIRANKSGAAG
ncbi:iron chelate uptake ABC transporter family permease subunit [Phytomonospora sp. NPDC050363]|uniref:FecCD family ABC transporter permease n=1 Tax=Phytomonospora sp. NPDC050363 TaxID=3155642 RepID=UPI003406A247